MQLVVCLLAVFIVLAYSAGVVARLLEPRLSARLRSTGVSASIIVAPSLVAFSVCCGLLLPGVLSAGCHCVEHGLHHPHFCVHHPDYAAPMLLPAALIVAAWGCFTLPRLFSLALSWWLTQRWVRRLGRLPVRVFESVSYCLVDAPGLGACTTGWFRPIIAVDVELWHALSDDELRAVLHHEEAHRRRLDPLSAVLLRGCVLLSGVSNSALALGRWRAGVEAKCDRYAAERVGSPECVASALLALERYHRARPEASALLGVGAGGSMLETRVRALLTDEVAVARPTLVSDAVVVGLAGVVVLLTVTLGGGDLIHHGAETALGFFVDRH